MRQDIQIGTYRSITYLAAAKFQVRKLTGIKDVKYTYRLGFSSKSCKNLSFRSFECKRASSSTDLSLVPGFLYSNMIHYSDL